MNGTRRTHRGYVAAGLFALGALLLAACVEVEPEAPPAPDVTPAAPPVDAPAGFLTFGRHIVAPSGDPHNITTAYPSHYLVFDALTTMDDSGNVFPSLAESWTWIDDETLELNLREGVTFQNGEPFDAASVEFSIDRIFDPERALAMRVNVDTIAGVEMVDSRTVRILTDAPDPILLHRLALLKMLPPQYMTENGHEIIETAPIGTGNYRLESIEGGRDVTLVAWPESWRGAPRIEQIRVVQMGDAASRMAALEAGDIQIANDVPPDRAADLAAAGFQIASPDNPAQAEIFELDAVGFEPFASSDVRAAMNYAVDKEEILQALLSGHGTISQGQLMGAGHPGFNADLAPFPYDVERARQLLQEAGYGDGFSAEMDYPAARSPELPLAVIEYLRAIDVDVELNRLEFAIFRDRIMGPGRSPFFYRLLPYFPMLDPSRALDQFRSTVSDDARRYDNPDFDALYQQTLTELDSDRRDALFREIAVITREDPPVLYLFHTGSIYGLAPNLHGYVARNDMRVDFADLWFD